MKVSHWTLCNGSGMHRVAEDLSKAEQALGIDSVLVQCDLRSEWEKGEGSDIYVVHTHLPDVERKQGSKVVWVSHGTVEHCFQSAVEEGLNKGYGASDPWMIALHWLKVADACVSWWPRQCDIWRSMSQDKSRVHCVPLGVDKSFWRPVDSLGKYAGTPSLFTAENCHYIKWPLDLCLMWPWVVEVVKDARLHLVYLPRDQHRWWLPLLTANDALFKMYLTGNVFDHETLRNAFCSTDYYVNMVRYGDFNRIGLEAKASGSKVISFRGNEYADYWLTEGDQREMALELLAILQGNIEPRTPEEVPDIAETAAKMVEIYAGVL